jgi:hypothetical protein
MRASAGIPRGTFRFRPLFLLFLQPIATNSPTPPSMQDVERSIKKFRVRPKIRLPILLYQAYKYSFPLNKCNSGPLLARGFCMVECLYSMDPLFHLFRGGSRVC